MESNSNLMDVCLPFVIGQDWIELSGPHDLPFTVRTPNESVMWPLVFLPQCGENHLIFISGFCLECIMSTPSFQVPSPQSVLIDFHHVSHHLLIQVWPDIKQNWVTLPDVLSLSFLHFPFFLGTLFSQGGGRGTPENKRLWGVMFHFDLLARG